VTAPSLRLSVGLLTAVPVPVPADPTERQWRRAILLAPVTGAALGGIAAGVLLLARLWADTDTTSADGNLLPCVVAVAALALLTRGLHLDGLADTVDGLGAAAKGGPARALEVMRRGDVGPFGVVAVVLVLLLQVAALHVDVNNHTGTVAIVMAATASRWAACLACVARPARPDGLGRLVLGRVGPVAAGLTGLGVAVFGLWVAALDPHTIAPTAESFAALAAAPAAALVTGLLVRRWRRAFGGMTGDTLGATVEIVQTVVLLVFVGVHP
jgi:adenosylcobinamide-GDP ribazoletransferase